MTVTLVPLRDSLRPAYLALQVQDSQKSFIETPAVSLRHMETRAWNIPWEIDCLFVGDTMVGYCMHGQNRFGDVWLDRFMVDKRFQGQGIGSQALSQILPMLRERYPRRRRILLSVEPENEGAIRLYEKFGFAFTGHIEDNEAVMALGE